MPHVGVSPGTGVGEPGQHCIVQSDLGPCHKRPCSLVISYERDAGSPAASAVTFQEMNHEHESTLHQTQSATR